MGTTIELYPITLEDIVYVYRAECIREHHLSAFEFSGGEQEEWPVKCTSRLATSNLIHPRCGADLKPLQIGDPV